MTVEFFFALDDKVESHAISISIERLLRASNSIRSSPLIWAPRFSSFEIVQTFSKLYVASAWTVKYQAEGERKDWNLMKNKLPRGKHRASGVEAGFKKPRFYDRNIPKRYTRDIPPSCCFRQWVSQSAIYFSKFPFVRISRQFFQRLLVRYIFWLKEG